MGKSARLTVSDVTAAVRLAWEAAELRSDPVAQGRHLVDGMARLIGGDVGFYCGIGDYVPGRLPRWLFAATGTQVPVPLIEYFARPETSVLEDPIMDVGRVVSGLSTLRMGAVLRDRDLTPYLNAIDIMRRFGHADALIGMFRRHDASAVTALSVHRTDIKRPYNLRERSIIKSLAKELAHLYETGRLEYAPAKPFENLSPRLQDVAERLLTSASEKQIAAAMNLSRHTVHDYVKRIYAMFEVDSRAAFILRFATRG